MTAYQFGVECEVSSGGASVLSHLYEEGHVSDNHLHAYHCGCPSCSHGRSGPDWTAQEDCTADAEFVSRILTTGDEGDAALEALSEALIAGRSTHDSNVGMHVHVDAGTFQTEDKVRMWRLWLTYQDDVGILARSCADRVRDYNGPNVTPRRGLQEFYEWGSEGRIEDFFDLDHAEAWALVDGYTRGGNRTGRWLSGGSNTWEFRLWNGSRSLWRIRMAVYVSVAFARAALDGYEARPDDGRTLLDAIGQYLPGDVYLSVVRQLMAQNIDQ